MLVKEACGDFPCHLIAQSHLWEKSIEKLTATEVSVFVRSHWGTPEYYESITQIENLMDYGWNAFLKKQIKTMPPMVKCDPRPPQRITVDELVSWLSETTPARRRAILFALETHLPISEVIDLTWAKLNMIRHGLSGYAQRLADVSPRHIRLSYVFWENMEGMIAGPLFGLGETVLEVSQGMGIDALKRLYSTAIPIDCASDVDDFSNKFCEELNRRLLELE